MKFECVQLVTSKGVEKDCSCRYLKITKFPGTDSSDVGRGIYVNDGEIISEFTFREMYDGCDNMYLPAQQANGRPFMLKRILGEGKNRNRNTLGFVWTFPDEYPLFEARFRRQQLRKRPRKKAQKRILARDTCSAPRGLLPPAFSKERRQNKSSIRRRFDKFRRHTKLR